MVSLKLEHMLPIGMIFIYDLHARYSFTQDMVLGNIQISYPPMEVV